MNMLKQRSPEWYKIKEGKFSASRASELLTTGSRKMTEDELIAYKKADPKGRRTTIDCIGDSLETYALEMAIEEIHGRNEEENFVSFDMQRGINLEPVAFRLFAEVKGHKFLTVEETSFIPYGEHAGCSPDGSVSDNSGVEIKCPKRTNFFKIVTNGIDEIDPKYIDQMQFQMLVGKYDRVYFVNYFQQNNKPFIHELIVNRDEERIKFMKERLEYAIERKKHFIKTIFNNSQLLNIQL